MTECKIINFNDGTGVEITNGDWRFSEEFPWIEEELEKLFSEGFKLTHVVPMLTPALQGEGNYTFYRGGFTVFLEREIQGAEQKLRLIPKVPAEVSSCEEEEDDTDLDNITADLIQEWESEGGDDESSNDNPA